MHEMQSRAREQVATVYVNTHTKFTEPMLIFTTAIYYIHTNEIYYTYSTHKCKKDTAQMVLAEKSAQLTHEMQNRAQE